jgi:hypothetical protein
MVQICHNAEHAGDALSGRQSSVSVKALFHGS